MWSHEPEASSQCWIFARLRGDVIQHRLLLVERGRMETWEGAAGDELRRTATETPAPRDLADAVERWLDRHDREPWAVLGKTSVHGRHIDPQEQSRIHVPDPELDVAAGPRISDPSFLNVVRGGNAAAVERILGHGRDPNVTSDDPGAPTPLGEALRNADPEMARVLTRAGARVRPIRSAEAPARDRDYRSLLAAVEAGNHAEVERRLAEGASPNPPSYLRSETRCLDAAVTQGDLRLVSLLLDHGAEGEGAPLHLAAAEGFTKVVRLLVARGHPVDELDEEGWTPLMTAANAGHAEVVRVLLDRGADVSHRARLGGDALVQAEREGHPEIAALLRSRTSPVVRVDGDE
ncbi:MAG: ankyrin repeat domain-containing protein [Myxococcota bacterium]|nr:ankyrin repeat domain-containing protein [Myxococcota bacterium]